MICDSLNSCVFCVVADSGLIMKLQSHAHCDHAGQIKHAFLSVKISVPTFDATRKYDVRNNGLNH